MFVLTLVNLLILSHMIEFSTNWENMAERLGNCTTADQWLRPAARVACRGVLEPFLHL